MTGPDIDAAVAPHAPAHRPGHPRRARGVALMEALIALVALAVGLLGLVGSQARLMADSRSNAQRAVAIGLIDDLSNRIVVNRDQALGGGYDLPWGAAPAPKDCSAAPCTAAQQAQSDLNQWVLAVQANLPGGTATVFRSASDLRQIGVAVSWTANESGTNATEQSARIQALNSSFSTGSGGLSCPSGNLCQLVYVQP